MWCLPKWRILQATSILLATADKGIWNLWGHPRDSLTLSASSHYLASRSPCIIHHGLKLHSLWLTRLKAKRPKSPCQVEARYQLRTEAERQFYFSAHGTRLRPLFFFFEILQMLLILLQLFFTVMVFKKKRVLKDKPSPKRHALSIQSVNVTLRRSMGTPSTRGRPAV